MRIRIGMILVLLLGFLAGACAQSRKVNSAGGTMIENAQSASPEAQAYKAECVKSLESARQTMEELEGLTGEKTVQSVLRPLNDLLRILSNGQGRASLLRNVHPDAGMRKVADWCEQELAKVETDLDLSRPIFDSVSAVDVSSEDERTQRFHALLIRDYKRAGVDKSDEIREKIKNLQQDLVKVGQKFGESIRSDVREILLDSPEELSGLPQDYIERHVPDENGKIRITTDYPDYIPFMTFAESDKRRLELYRVFRNRAWPKNEDVLKDMLRIRSDLAKLLGYADWADYVTGDKMIGSAEAAQAFIDKAASLAKKRASLDYQELLERLKKIDPKAEGVGDWQKTYLQELLKRDKYKVDSQQLRPYFAFEKVQGGILSIASRMYGVEFNKVELPVWHAAVDAYEILDGGEVIGRFYLDMHPRPDKYKHAAAFPIKPGIQGVQVPEAALVCNFPGGDGSAGLMDHNSVETFFHEFGHLLHHLFGGQGQSWVTQSGIATEWDFVEAPSQLFEEWAWEYDVLKTFATNGDGAVIPEKLVAKMRRARDFGKGLFVSHQMYYAALSLAFYDADPASLDLATIVEDLQRKYSPFDYVDGTHFHVSFGHLFGYSATYYTYMWSLVIANDLLRAFKDVGFLDEGLCRSYRKKVLEPGGSRDAGKLVEDFLGRPFNFEAFEQWLSAG